MYEVKDKVVLVTGGAAGIGAGVVQAFLKENAKHVAALDLDVTNGQALEREMTAKYGPGKIKFYKCDVTTNDLEDAYESIVDEYGYIDIVVNNAGIMNDRPNSYLKEITVNVRLIQRNGKHGISIFYESEFQRGTSAAETARRINDVSGAGVAKENTVRFWFQCFRSGNFDLQNKPRERPETKVDNEELKAIVEADPLQTTSGLAAGFGVIDKTVLIYLKQIGKVKKFERWVPHELSESNQKNARRMLRYIAEPAQ